MANHIAAEIRSETVSTYALFVRWLVTLLTLPAGKLKTPYRLYAVAALICEGLQLYFRISHGFALHVTTAILLWAFSVALSIQVWAPTWKRA